MKRTGGQLIVEALKANGVSRVSCVPGESYLAVLDALYESGIETVVCRQEGGAAMMADTWGRLTGEPGICMVTRGPGATNASAGLHIARQDSIPMILFIGQVQREAREREAFQEVEYRRAFTEFAKWVGEIDDARRIPEFVTRAFAVATSGRPGPVVLTLPEDMLVEEVEAPKAKPYTPVEAHPGPSQMAAFAKMLDEAKRPVFIIGGTRWSEESVAGFKAFAENNKLPVGCSFRRQMLFDHLSPSYAGDVGIGINPALAKEIKEADLVVLLGGRLSEMPSSGYTLLDIPYPSQKLVHIYPEAEELGRVYRPDLAICAAPDDFVAALSSLTLSANAWADRTAAMHAAYLTWSTPPKTGPGAVQMGPIMDWIEANVPEDAIFTNGAGNYATWVHRFHRFRRFNTQSAPTSGSMGYGLPAAVAAKHLFPEREVICFAGDGCFMMHGQEFITAVRYGLPIITVLVNNGTYGTIRMHQEREYPGRVSGTDLVNPDFNAFAKAYGGHGETVERTQDFAAAFERARASGKPAIIEVKLDAEAITPTRTLTQIRTGS
ncbi:MULTISPECIES: thiamine pyrophosphate-binding protein [unclassified Agrobacterium]|uniref:thiamine pyrophosphate-binding protein n=1 Tax=unclassified Agrobacterium TaxID=2632611 RepID=UPI00244C192F|nr:MULTISPECIES: thiamine pyrophosphate-binding protein [unclassified Agrobacterium]MDH0613884.1 thiamine pyrophosphate-binding protein [Agrobacterium sp. GD03872]MDH0696773.1 thiamine pyrophosphate-binding protein [Agrobacterium sp. GD03871]MDH1060063.1 thiamine pyrophosphate-binding protein [Agrobacterium sp. GD03992]MDH2209976.1 thiamine pyrophosphate-binding protein [Agrobacterium sp. GD03643]MDH2219475.1 thiamine pyrophosphate-binding protein [Agrobacterium sp. GD03638]